MINDYQKTNKDITNSVLVLDIKNIIDGGDNHILKITYNNNPIV